MDQLNATLCLDEWTTEQLRFLAPHMSVFDLNAPRQVSKNLSMPKPVVATIANYIHREEEVDPVKLSLMDQIPTVGTALPAPVTAAPATKVQLPPGMKPRRRVEDRTERATDKKSV